jgi:hypothetical protein
VGQPSGDAGSVRSLRLSSLRPAGGGARADRAAGNARAPEDLPRYPAVLPSHMPNSNEWRFARGEEEPITIRVTGRFAPTMPMRWCPRWWGAWGLG